VNFSVQTILEFAIWLAILVPSIVFHEVAHGYAAAYLGDTTAKDGRRLSLNPLRHIDPWGTLLMPALLLIVSQGQFAFGYAKPVPVNPARFRGDREWGMFSVAMAGPATNLALALVGSLVFRVLVIVFTLNPPSWAGYLLTAIVIPFVRLNLVLMFFNLIPVPPLDGSRVLPLILPKSAWPFLAQMERYGFTIIFAILFIGPMLFQWSPLTWYLDVTVFPLMRVLLGA
jgi:Zn-dependent protease